MSRPDSSLAALCLDDSPLAVAMADAYRELFGGPLPRWSPGTPWPRPDLAECRAFHAKVDALLYARLNIDPLTPTVGPLPVGGHALTDRERQRIIDLRRQRVPCIAIAAQVGCTERTVHRVLRRAEGRAGGPHGPTVQALHAQGASDDAIAAATGLTRQRVGQIRELLGLRAHYRRPPMSESTKAKIRAAAQAQHARRRAA